MNGDVPVFECPFNGTKFESKNYIENNMPQGMNYMDFFGLETSKKRYVEAFPQPRPGRDRITHNEITIKDFHSLINTK